MTTVAIAGASGFVGRALTTALTKSPAIKIIGLTRQSHSSQGITWRTADLFSVKQAEAGIDGADIAVWLVHSMMPRARLVQGNFADIDLMLADNFARACRERGVKRIVYLGGIIADGDLSPHLASRLEVESALASTGIPVTTVRAGLIVGAGGSSFTIMERLVRRLPVMLCPAWTDTKSQPVSIDDVVACLARLVSEDHLPAGNYDIGGPDTLTYLGMLREMASALQVRRWLVRFPLFTVRLSRLWLSLVTGSPAELVRPLVQSLRHPMLVRPHANIAAELSLTPKPFRESLNQALANSNRTSRPHAPSRHEQPTQNLVFSMQRLRVPKGANAPWLAMEYGRWLVGFMYPILRVTQSREGHLSFRLRAPGRIGIELLHLRYAIDRSSLSRQLFYITGGLLASKQQGTPGRLEFRMVNEGREALAAIMDFRPSLPWWIYKFTQAIAHVWVMRNFRRHLSHIAKAS